MNSREKGIRGELELAHKLEEYGYGCRRGQQFCGKNGDADVVGLPGIHIEAKRVEKLNIYDAIKQAVRDAKEGLLPAVMHRKNRQEWLVTMRMDDWMKLYKEARGMSCIIENYVPVGRQNAVTREFLVSVTGLSDRKVRELIKASDELIINLQDGNGYFRPSQDEDFMVRAYIRQEQARGKNVYEGIKKADRYLKAKRRRDIDRDSGQMTIEDFLKD